MIRGTRSSSPVRRRQDTLEKLILLGKGFLLALSETLRGRLGRSVRVVWVDACRPGLTPGLAGNPGAQWLFDAVFFGPSSAEVLAWLA